MQPFRACRWFAAKRLLREPSGFEVISLEWESYKTDLEHNDMDEYEQHGRDKQQQHATTIESIVSTIPPLVD